MVDKDEKNLIIKIFSVGVLMTTVYLAAIVGGVYAIAKLVLEKM